MKSLWDTVFQPASLDEALARLAAAGDTARIVAGGTDVVVELSRGVRPTRTLIDISRVPDLRGIRDDGDAIRLGGLATHNDVISSQACVAGALPLAQACLEIGAPQLRARATVAGNIATASPANDTLSPLIALGATVSLRSNRGSRSLPIAEFITGFRQTVLQPDELIEAISVPRLKSGQRGIYRKLGLRRAQAISVVHLAIVLDIDRGRVTAARVALGCVAPTVIRAPETEAYLAGRDLNPEVCRRAGEIAAAEATPIDDVRGSGAYRTAVLARMVSNALETLAAGHERHGWPARPVLLDTGTRTTAPPAFDGAVTANVNGETSDFGAAAHTMTLLNAVRDDLGLTGAKEGCAEGECGACTMWLDGQAVMSCLVPATQAHGCQVTTIEGLAGTQEHDLHPLQDAFIDAAAVQCGYCIPGMIMAGAKLLDERSQPSQDDTRAALGGNLCRCTGYTKIVEAMTQAARHVQ